jgi:hypothetical protein
VLVFALNLVLILGSAHVKGSDLLLLLIIPYLVLVAVYVLGQRSIDARERSARYTTDPWRNPDVDFVDWKTGWVLRDAGQPLFSSKKELQDARERAESWTD